MLTTPTLPRYATCLLQPCPLHPARGRNPGTKLLAPMQQAARSLRISATPTTRMQLAHLRLSLYTGSTPQPARHLSGPGGGPTHEPGIANSPSSRTIPESGSVPSEPARSHPVGRLRLRRTAKSPWSMPDRELITPAPTQPIARRRLPTPGVRPRHSRRRIPPPPIGGLRPHRRRRVWPQYCSLTYSSDVAGL